MSWKDLEFDPAVALTPAPHDMISLPFLSHVSQILMFPSESTFEVPPFIRLAIGPEHHQKRTIAFQENGLPSRVPVGVPA